MSDELRVACPHCGSQFRLKSRQSLGRRLTCRDCGDGFTARSSTASGDDGSAEDSFSAETELPPRGTRRPAGPARRKKPTRRQPFNRWVFICGGLAIVVILAIALSGPLAKLAGEARRMANNVADSPDRALSDVASIRAEVRKTLASVSDKASHDTAIEKFKQLRPRVEELILRASRFEPLADQEVEALLQRHLKEFPLNPIEEFQNAQKLTNSGQNTREFREALFPLDKDLVTAFECLETGLRPLPQPPNNPQRLVYDSLEIYRGVARRLAKVASAGELEGAAGDVTKGVGAVKELVVRAQSLGREPITTQQTMQTQKLENIARHQQVAIIRILDERHGKHAGLHQALADLERERENVRNAVRGLQPISDLPGAGGFGFPPAQGGPTTPVPFTPGIPTGTPGVPGSQ